MRLLSSAMPAPHDKPTDSTLAVVRSEMADSLRHSSFHINFINPSLNTLAQSNKTTRSHDDTDTIEGTMEDKYLKHCDPENAIHFITIWTTRSTLARNRLLRYYSLQSKSPTPPTEEQRGDALRNAIKMVECDTRLRTSPLARGYLWFVDMYLPALAFNHLLNALAKQPVAEFANAALEAMSDN